MAGAVAGSTSPGCCASRPPGGKHSFPPGGRQPHLLCRLHVYRGRRGEPKAFGWRDYRDLITAAHQQLGIPLVWCWDNLNVHLAAELADFATDNKDWLRIYRMPAYAPELNPAEGVWSLLKRPMPFR
ncbi:transposase [Actinomadura sp. ATCC 31491]|uniref:Transposase n=1 Tax=Actinomadura luzonensis TaxID=2805427 RepID=A0ABT0FWW4_9ACTN|nr:transposase [Actinomadura luzonensis]MCK2216373.1 transposase [Actinomadura luzonensis]